LLRRASARSSVLGFELVEGELEFPPAIVIERPEGGSGMGDGVAQRGEEPIGAEATVLDADGAQPQRGREVGMLRAGDPRGPQLYEGSTWREVLDDLLA